jgi:hypothetical protein
VKDVEYASWCLCSILLLVMSAQKRVERLQQKFYILQWPSGNAIQLQRVHPDYPSPLGWGGDLAYLERKQKEFLGLLPVEPHVKYKVVYGYRWIDCLWGIAPCEYMISERVKKAFEVEGVSGWEVVPVEIEHDPPPPWSYYRLIVKGRCGEVRSWDPEKEWPPWYEFECETWDGSDIFASSIVAYPFRDDVFTTRRVREIKRKYKLQMHLKQCVFCV